MKANTTHSRLAVSNIFPTHLSQSRGSVGRGVARALELIELLQQSGRLALSVFLLCGAERLDIVSEGAVHAEVLCEPVFDLSGKKRVLCVSAGIWEKVDPGLCDGMNHATFGHDIRKEGR